MIVRIQQYNVHYYCICFKLSQSRLTSVGSLKPCLQALWGLIGELD